MLVVRYLVKVMCVYFGGIKIVVVCNVIVVDGEDQQMFVEFFDCWLVLYLLEMVVKIIVNGVVKGQVCVVVGLEVKVVDVFVCIMGLLYQWLVVVGVVKFFFWVKQVYRVLERDIMMKIIVVVLFEVGKLFELMEFDFDGLGLGEVLVKYIVVGLCYFDLYFIDGDLLLWFLIVGGYEGFGVIEEVGVGVIRVKFGDYVVCSFILNCGICCYCCIGWQNLCDMGVIILEGCMLDGSF